jgi:hypothetical protein
MVESCGRVAVWSGKVVCCGLFGWLMKVGGDGWFNKFGRVTVAGEMRVVVETFAICSELSKGNTCSWKRR